MIAGYQIDSASTRARKAVLQMDALAEHIAEGGNFSSFGRLSGISEAAARKCWRKIVSGLVTQAI